MAPMAVFSVWLVIGLLVVFVYAWMAVSTRGAAGEEAAYQALGRLRRPLFILMLVVLGILFAFTIPRTPYPRGQIPDEVVHAVGKQFQFVLSSQPIRSDEEFIRASATPLKISRGRLVEFRVTSLDVNHPAVSGYDGLGDWWGRRSAGFDDCH
jgi:heme/copper-type cytochrome/quinol oxidase subunit 2